MVLEWTKRVGWIAALALIVFAPGLPGCGGDDGDTATYDSPYEDRLDDLDSWLYQLRNLDPDQVAASRFDLVVTDYSADGTAEGAWSAADVETLKERDRLCLAYLPIGEVDDSRWYWDESWTDDAPEWLADPVEDASGFYRVRFWEDGWKNTVFQWVDIIAAQGFDGVYLDFVDQYEYWTEQGIEDANERMIDFVREIAARGRRPVPFFLVFPQNATDLVWYPRYTDAIDGVGAESTWFEDDSARPSSAYAPVLENLDQVVDRGRQVLAVDYVSDPDDVDTFYRRARNRDYVPYATTSDRDAFVINEGHEP